ncbi:MAG: cysteine--tRNA ligase, partial [Candidatus Pacebacteria bacterium CG10_big_fil_rev_8_21_14_0_10_45_6]
AKEFEAYFFKSMDGMGNLRPDVSCRATEHIEAQIALVQKLEQKGFTYKIEDDGMYFDTSKLPDYGKLNPQELSQLREGERIGVVVGKKNPTDFALWKFEKPGEDRQMSWPSPWSERGFPGWHIECSAMSMQYLGEQIDIHTGGIDHIPVHHSNEIAQSEAATGKVPFVRFWVHHNHLQVDGQKMSKSLGNFFTIDDVIERKFNPRALRLLFLQGQYRDQMNFTWESLVAVQTAYDRLARQVQSWGSEVAQLSPQAEKLRQAFFAALADDLKTAQAIATLWEMTKSELPVGEKLQLFREFDAVLQLGFENIQSVELSAEIQQLLQERDKARAEKNWQKADELREKLSDLGHMVADIKL